MPQASGYANAPIHRLGFLGPRGEHAFLGSCEIRIGGSGMVATLFGAPGVSATLTATGTYSLKFPGSPSKPTGMTPAGNGGQFWPTVRNPTGIQGFQAAPGVLNSWSGTAQLHTFGGALTPSGFAPKLNMPSGMTIDVLFSVYPITPY